MTSGYGAVGSALVWGARGREFKSRYSDQNANKRHLNSDAVYLWFNPLRIF